MKTKAKLFCSLASAIEAPAGVDLKLSGLLFSLVNQARERCAFLDELGMRIRRKYEWNKPELTEEEKAKLEQRWPEQAHLIMEVGAGKPTWLLA